MTDRGPAPPRFLVDAMLGRLARWLRVIGLDAASDDDEPDAVLVRRATDEDRILLTRDRHLIRELRPPRVLEITSDAAGEQLAQVVRALGIPAPRALFTRCLLCNVELTTVPDDERDVLVPRESRVVPGPVRRCTNCGRVYWQGSHARRMRDALARAVPEWHLIPVAGPSDGGFEQTT